MTLFRALACLAVIAALVTPTSVEARKRAAPKAKPKTAAASTSSVVTDEGGAEPAPAAPAAAAMLEPVRKEVGNLDQIIAVIDNSRSRLGAQIGQKAWSELKRMGNTKGITGGYEPTDVGYFNGQNGPRYLYTEKGGWVDILHFMFYAGLAGQYKDARSKDPVGDAIKWGYFQEGTDKLKSNNSAFSYEDLPSDKFGADFAVNHFNVNSTGSDSLGWQIKVYLRNLGATDPQNAPNWDQLPEGNDETRNPLRRNYSTTPIFTK